MSDHEAEMIRHRIEDRRDRMSETIDAIGYKADVPSRVKESISNRTHAVKETVLDRTHAVTDSISHATHALFNQVSNQSEGAYDAVTDKYGAVTEQGKKLGSTAQDNPLAFAVGGAAAGFLLGMLFPSTKMESERIGPMAHDIRSTVVETADEALERGKHVAEEAYHAAGEAVMETGQQEAEEMGESVKQKAQNM